MYTTIRHELPYVEQGRHGLVLEETHAVSMFKSIHTFPLYVQMILHLIYSWAISNVISNKKWYKTVLTMHRHLKRILKVHKHEIFFVTFFAETETIWSQGPVTRDF
jgi:hypothetical protein